MRSLDEEVPTNNAGAGNVAGIGVPPEDVAVKKRKKIPTFRRFLQGKKT